METIAKDKDMRWIKPEPPIAVIGVDGNCSFALFGEDLQVGECETSDASQPYGGTSENPRFFSTNFVPRNGFASYAFATNDCGHKPTRTPFTLVHSILAFTKSLLSPFPSVHEILVNSVPFCR